MKKTIDPKGKKMELKENPLAMKSGDIISENKHAAQKSAAVVRRFKRVEIKNPSSVSYADLHINIVTNLGSMTLYAKESKYYKQIEFAEIVATALRNA